MFDANPDPACRSASNRGSVWPWVLLALGLSLLFFSPRLWLMGRFEPGTTQWARAHTFLQQCEDPFRRDVEPAMLWRMLPPMVAHYLHLPGRTPLVLPWLGLLALLGYGAVVLRRQNADSRFVFGGTLLVATTSAALVPTGWLGINDAWVWLGLLVVAFGRARWSTPLACLLCPWVDERFVIAFPLAWLVARDERREPLLGPALREGLWLLPYLAGRIGFSAMDAGAGAATADFLRGQVPEAAKRLPLAPLAWWMALRAAWLAACYAVWVQSGWHRRWTILAAVGILVFMALVASDMSRSAAAMLPLVTAGCLALARRYPKIAPRLVLAAGISNLLIPAAHVVYLHIDPISPLPLELFRLLR